MLSFWFLIAFTGFGVFMFARNEWVYKKRVELFKTDMDRYKKLPSYHNMMWRFWIWDVNKF